MKDLAAKDQSQGFLISKETEELICTSVSEKRG